MIEATLIHPKTLVVLLHGSGVVVSGWILWKLQSMADRKLRVVCQFQGRNLAKKAILTICWNLALLALFLFVIDGQYPSSYDLSVLWPALGFYIQIGLCLDYRTFREDDDCQEPHKEGG